MSPTRILLVRHGQSGKNVAGQFGGHSKTPLSKIGRRQAEETAKRLANENIDKIYSSDLPRATQTAEPLANQIKKTIQLTKDLRERNVGRLEGLTFREAKEKYPNDYFALVSRSIDYRLKDGESYRELLERATPLLETIIKEQRGKNVAIYSHTGTICFLSLYLLNAITPSTRNTPWLATSNCGINRFEIRKRNNVRVVALNDTRHLT